MSKADREMTIKREEELVDTLVSFAEGEYMVMRETGWGLPFLREFALSHNVEKCPGCGRWTHSMFLLSVDSDEPDGRCDNCRTGE